ncbi:hypothetical protein [Pseudoxanthomonas japonensis]|uniref:hypothetical protein n=1 Tax=Pseudoxanthomonas japonensis TaxID=69284 RepID=UPI001BCA9C01|nr:hypothetical protein [Pseudoxanthomonas japonensis]
MRSNRAGVTIFPIARAAARLGESTIDPFPHRQSEQSPAPNHRRSAQSSMGPESLEKHGLTRGLADPFW